jgi:hypothetical protein
MNYLTLVKSTLIITGLSALAASPLRADNMADIAINFDSGAVTVTPRWAVGGDLAGFHHMAQNLGLTGGAANNLYSITNKPIPMGGNTLAFKFYVAGSGSATPHSDIGSKLTPDSYSALTSADPDVGYGSVNFYLIHHKGTTDYFTAITPGSATSSSVTDEKPMSGPGGPDTVTGESGYFGLTFAAANLGYGLNNFYYLRNDSDTGTVKFGTLAPALLGLSADQFDIGAGGFKALAFTGSNVGYGTDKMYYTRLDPITGYTILGMLDPALDSLRRTADIANLGSVYSTLTFAAGDIGYGPNRFYTTGTINPTWQSVSFAAIADRDTVNGSFTVNPTASSSLPLTLTVVSGSVGAASITGPVGGVFTVTPTAPGLITLQATQAGQPAPAAPVYSYNMLRQSFTIAGDSLLAITTQPVAQSAVTGDTVNFSVVAEGTTTVGYQWRKDGVAIPFNASATTDTLTLTNVQTADAASYDVVVTNDSGSIPSDAVTLTVALANTTLVTVQGSLTEPISLTEDGLPPPSGTVYYAKGLPAGLVLDASTGQIISQPGTHVSAKPGTYTVTYGTIITDINGHKTKGPAMTLQIIISPLPTGLSGGFETILEAFPSPGSPEGKVELLVNARTGAFTGKLTYSNLTQPYGFKGVLTLDPGYTTGSASVIIKRRGGAPYRLDLSIDSLETANLVFLASLQQLDTSNAFVATLAESASGVQLANFTKGTPTPWQGVYTLILDDPTTAPLDLGATTAPEGTGFARVNIKASGGIMSIKGTLGDGTRLTASLAPSADGSYRWYGQPYRNGGFFGGWIQFTPIAGGIAPYQISTSSSSELYWAKNPSIKDKSYRAGFGPIVIVATAQNWIEPTSGATLSARLRLPESLVLSSFTSASLPNADTVLVPNMISFDDKNKFVVIAPAANSNNFTAKARTSDGGFTGSFVLQDGRKVPVAGMFIQQSEVISGSVIGEGYFMIPPATKGAESVTGKIQFVAP